MVVVAVALLILNCYYISDLDKFNHDVNGLTCVNGVRFDGTITNAPVVNSPRSFSNSFLPRASVSHYGSTRSNAHVKSTNDNHLALSRVTSWNVSPINSNLSVGLTASQQGLSTSGVNNSSTNTLGGNSQNFLSQNLSTSGVGENLNSNGGNSSQISNMNELFDHSTGLMDEGMNQDIALNPFDTRQKASMNTMDAPLEDHFIGLLCLSLIYFIFKVKYSPSKIQDYSVFPLIEKSAPLI